MAPWTPSLPPSPAFPRDTVGPALHPHCPRGDAVTWVEKGCHGMESHIRGSWCLRGEPGPSPRLMHPSSEGLVSLFNTQPGSLGTGSGGILGVRSSASRGRSRPGPGSGCPGPIQVGVTGPGRATPAPCGRSELRGPGGSPSCTGRPHPVSGRLLSLHLPPPPPGPLPQASSQPGVAPRLHPFLPALAPRTPGLASCSWSCAPTPPPPGAPTGGDGGGAGGRGRPEHTSQCHSGA